MHSFLEFLSELANPEVSRKFQTKGNYTLEPLQKFWEEHLPKSRPKIRFSIVGTNGKGSTAHFLAQHLQKTFPESKIGLFTSPHLITPLERIQVSGKNVEESILNDAFSQITSKDKSFTYFEWITTIAVRAFQELNCEYEVWEAGLGGRLDATKLVEADYVLLTKIGLDHCEILGRTKEEIAREKVAISSPKTKCLFSISQPQPLESFLAIEAKEIPILFAPQSREKEYLKENFAFAKWALEKIAIFSPLVWEECPPLRGRMEEIKPGLYYDTAHNPEALERVIQELNPDQVVIGVLPDKDRDSMAKVLVQAEIKEVLVVERNGFAEWDSYFGWTKIDFADLDLMNLTPKKDQTILVCGSFRLYQKFNNP